MLRSLMALVKPVLMLLPQSLTATTTTSSIDTAGFGSLALQLIVGTFAFDGTNKLTVTVEHSDDNSSWSTVAAGEIKQEVAAGTFIVLDSAAEDDSVHVCDYLGNKRYVRMVITEAGAVTAVVGVVALLGHPMAAPVR